MRSLHRPVAVHWLWPRRSDSRRSTCRLLFAVLVVPFVSTHGLTAQVSQGWDVITEQEYVYNIVVDMAFDVSEHQFTEQDQRTLTVTIANGQVEFVRESAFEKSSEHFGPYLFSEDGTISILANPPPPPNDALKIPPLEAELLLHIFLPPPFQPGLHSWEVVDPPDALLGDDKIEIQQRTEFQAAGMQFVDGDTWKRFNVRSSLRLIDNDAAVSLIGPPEQRSPEIQQIMQDLGQFGLFLVGTVRWNVDDRVTPQYEATDVPILHSGGTPGSVMTSERHQRLVATLQENKP